MEQLSNMPMWAQILSMGSFMFASGVLMTRIPFAPALILLMFGLIPNLFPTGQLKWTIFITIALVLMLSIAFAIVFQGANLSGGDMMTSAVGLGYSIGLVVLLLLAILVILPIVGFCSGTIVRLFQWEFSLQVVTWQHIWMITCFILGILYGIYDWHSLWFAIDAITTVLALFLSISGLLMLTGRMNLGLFVFIGVVSIISSRGLWYRYIPPTSLEVKKILRTQNEKKLQQLRYANLKGMALPLDLGLEKAEHISWLLNAGVDVNAKDNYGHTALMIAAGGNYSDTVQLLLQQGADVNATDNDGETALMWAAADDVNFQSGHIFKKSKEHHSESLRLLLEHGANVNAKSGRGTTALMEALKGSDPEVIRLLLDHGADINVREPSGDEETILMLALKKHPEIAKFLIEQGVNVNEGRALLVAVRSGNDSDIVKLLLDHGADVHACTELMAAAENSSPEIVKLLLEHGVDVNAKDKYGKTALMWAVPKNTSEVVRLLLERGADVNAQDKHGETVLMKAVLKDTSENVKLLLEHGADVNAKDKYGKTALMETVSHYSDKSEIIKLLLEHGADVNAKDNDGQTALMEAVRKKYTENIKLLLKHGADANAKDGYGDRALTLENGIPFKDIEIIKLLLEQKVEDNDIDMALIRAARYDEPEIAQLLLERGANVNAKDNDGHTALMEVGYYNHDMENRDMEMVKLLLEHGADVNAKDKYGQTALMFTVENPECVKLLLNRGADVNAKDREGQTALMKAQIQLHIESEKLLKSAGAKE